MSKMIGSMFDGADTFLKEGYNHTQQHFALAHDDVGTDWVEDYWMELQNSF